MVHYHYAETMIFLIIRVIVHELTHSTHWLKKYSLSSVCPAGGNSLWSTPFMVVERNSQHLDFGLAFSFFSFCFTYYQVTSLVITHFKSLFIIDRISSATSTRHCFSNKFKFLGMKRVIHESRSIVPLKLLGVWYTHKICEIFLSPSIIIKYKLLDFVDLFISIEVNCLLELSSSSNVSLPSLNYLYYLQTFDFNKYS